MDTKKFILLISALTAVICALTVVYNFASMPAYGDTEVSAVPLYASSVPSAEAVPSSVEVSSSKLSPKNSSLAAGSSSRVSMSAPSAESSVTTTEKASSVADVSSSTRKPHKSRTKSKKTATTSNPINLNTATAEQLETIPHIGETRANAIIAYRNAHGAFKNINDLDNVKGFGKKMIAKVGPYLTTT